MFVIKVSAACKKFQSKSDSTKVLCNLNMKVAQGTIYALMGSSGCGKTTLISSLVDVFKLDSGAIEIFGDKVENIAKSRVGYMPQENALIAEFTVGEMIWFMGTIFGLKSEHIEERLCFLTNLLELPQRDKILKECSGGQQRRVSFAITLIHEPELLILDEPTVGLDPLLRFKIWDYLNEITRTNNVTVLLSTHYIEEAKQSTHIGLMRNGELIAEDSPQRILRMTECDNLDEAFLQLSEKQERGDARHCPDSTIILSIKQEDNLPQKIFEGQKQLSGNHFEPSTSPKMKSTSTDEITAEKKSSKQFICHQTNLKILWALFIKNMIQLLRNIDVLVIAVILPAIGCFCMHYAVGGKINGLMIGIVNSEIASLDECSNRSLLSTEIIDYNCRFERALCRFMNEIGDEIDEKIFYNTFDEAFDDTKIGKIIGFIRFSRNFSDSLTLFNDESRYDLGDDGIIQVYLDQTNLPQTLIVRQKLYNAYESFSEKLMTDCGKSPRAGSLPIVFEAAFGNINFDMRLTFIAGFLLISCFEIAAFILCVSINSERGSGTWNRCIVAGARPIHFLMSHLLEGLLVMVIHVTEYSIYALVFLQPSLNFESAVTLCFLMLCAVLTGILFGLLCSVVMKSQLGSYTVSQFTVFPVMIVSGLMWPFEGMPLVLQFIGNVLPLARGAVAVRNILSKQATFCDPAVFSAFVTLGIWIIVQFILCVWFVRVKK